MSENRRTPAQLIVRVEPSLHREFKAATALQGVPMQEVMVNAIDAYLRERRSGVSIPAAALEVVP
jgi:predicted HicB family RNase H-like nuclease